MSKVKHKIGNQYEFLGHTLNLVEMVESTFGVIRYKLDCTAHRGCCTIPNGIQMECVKDELDIMKCVKEIDSRHESVRKPEVDWQEGDTAVIKEGWDRAGISFTVLGPAVFLEQWWVPVEDPDEDDPTFHKEAGLRKVEEEAE